MLFWSVIVFLVLNISYGIAYLYARKTGTPMQRKYSFVLVLSLIAGSLTFLGIYFSKKFGVQQEYKIIVRIVAYVFMAIAAFGYLLKNYKNKKK